MPRILCCYDCGEMTFMRDGPTSGRVDEDQELIELTRRHQHPEIPDDKIKGGNLFTVDQATFDKYGDKAVIEMKDELAKNQIWMYEMRDQLKEDAMECFNKHHRPTFHCSDFEAEEKIIGKKIGVPKEKRQYLCHYCPFTHGVVIPHNRWKKGMYK